MGDELELEQVKQAVRDYHLALDNRENGDVAGYRLIDKVQEILDMNWERGAEKERRQKEGAQ